MIAKPITEGVARNGDKYRLALVAGNYSGISGHAGGRIAASFSIDTSGNLSGRNSACRFDGTVTPRSALNAFDWTVRALTSGCIFGGTASGILYYDQAARRVHAFAPFEARSDLYYLIGSK